MLEALSHLRLGTIHGFDPAVNGLLVRVKKQTIHLEISSCAMISTSHGACQMIAERLPVVTSVGWGCRRYPLLRSSLSFPNWGDDLIENSGFGEPGFLFYIHFLCISTTTTMIFMAVSSNGLPTEEPCCPKCGYNLFGLPEFRCPECGTPFDPDFLLDIDTRTHLLPWERPEMGRRLKRLYKTILQASLHPGRFFSAINQRKDKPIDRAGSLVAACVIASISFYVVPFLLIPVVFFLRVAWKHGASQKNLHSAASLLRASVSSVWLIPSVLILSSLLSVFLIAVLLTRVFRSRSGALRTMDLAAVFSPAIAFGAFIAAICQVVQSIHYGIMGIVEVMVWSQDVVLLLLVWHCCRKLLALSLTKTVLMVIACGLLKYGAGCAVGFASSQLFLAIYS